MKNFNDLNLSENVMTALHDKGFEAPSPIQAQVIPILMETQRDVIGQAQTGTGKTAAFGIPLIEQLDEAAEFVQALIMTPTRELAIQVAEEIHSLKGKKTLLMFAQMACRQCRTELEELSAKADQIDSGYVVLVDVMPERAVEVYRAKGFKLKAILDPEFSIAPLLLEEFSIRQRRRDRV